MPETVTMIQCLFCSDPQGPKVAEYEAHLLEVHGYTRPPRVLLPRLAFIQVPLCPHCHEPRLDDERVAEGRECAACAYVREPEVGETLTLQQVQEAFRRGWEKGGGE